MSAFIGYGEFGVWTTNSNRNAFLDWFAAHRCHPHDERWELCMSHDWRWPGCDIELSELISPGVPLDLTGDEYDAACLEYWPHFAQLLGIIDTMTRGEWQIRANSTTALNWSRPKRGNSDPPPWRPGG